MRLPALALILALTACSPGGEAPAGSDANNGGESVGSPPDTPLRPASDRPVAATGEWSIDSGTLLFTDAADDSPGLVISCRGGSISVRLPGVAPIGSEERLTIGGGGDVEALVANSVAAGDTVEAHGPAPTPDRLHAFLTAGPGASYGATAIGPLAPVPDGLATRFVESCR